MPGAYSHMTMASVMSSRNELNRVGGMPQEVIRLLGRWSKFCELGSVSPDYPYLDLGNANSARWADRMHYTHTDRMIKAAIEQLRGISGEAQEKGLAWLLGYVAHVVMDVTIHPVVNAIVGPYEQNKTDHRVCEMHQDVHIFKTSTGGLDVTTAEFLDRGLRKCGDDDGNLDQDVRGLWRSALSRAYPDESAVEAPNPDNWHRGFCRIVDNIAEEGAWLVALTRHTIGEIGITYPNEADSKFIVDLPPPEDATDRSPLHYDAIFDKAKKNVGKAWLTVARSVLDRDDSYQAAFVAWNLDTGKNEAGQLVYWA